MSQQNIVDIKNVDDITKKIVFGYIARCQKILPKNNTYYNIPSLVSHICILYYWNPEFWSVYGNGIIVNDDK